MSSNASETAIEEQVPQPVETPKPRKKVVMTEKALENLKKAREILKKKRQDAKDKGVKLISKKKLAKQLVGEA